MFSVCSCACLLSSIAGLMEDISLCDGMILRPKIQIVAVRTYLRLSVGLDWQVRIVGIKWRSDRKAQMPMTDG